MSSISNCPHCGQQVLIPGELDSDALVRCPICEAEFPVARALANAVEAPPELVPVARVSVQAEENASGLLASPPSVSGQDKDEEEGLALPSLAGSEPAPGSGEGKPTGHAEPVATAERAQRGAVPGEPATEGHARGREAYDFVRGVVGTGGTASAVTEALSRGRQQKTAPLGGAGKLIGIIIAGLLGIVVAYLVLSLASPRNFDFLNLWGRPRQDRPGPAVPAPQQRAGPQRPPEFDPDDPWRGLKQEGLSGAKPTP